jgi:putative transposase
MDAFHRLQPSAGTASACAALGINRAEIYRQRAPRRHTMPPKPRARSAIALCETERRDIIEILDSERFVDVAPATIYATLLDEGRYHGSVSTMYRVLKSAQQTGERRRQHKHPVYTKPELLAVQPNQVWSWDITKLRGPIKWSYFHLYVILDIFSRYVVGWMIAPRETAELAKQLIADTVEKQHIDPGTLTLHADRGTSMRSKPVSALLVDLDVAKTHSRPHLSDDNPFSEAQL